MTVLLALLVLNAVLHAVLIARFGTASNQPFLVFAIVYAVLAVITWLAVPYALWAVLVLAVIGLVGLTVTFNKPIRDKTLDRIIWVADVAVVLWTLYLLFQAG